MALPPYASLNMAFPPYASPTPSPLDDSSRHFLGENFKNISTVAEDIFTLACFLAFSFFIGFDVWEAFKKRAIWLPGKAFALSGVTVQIIVWWTTVSNIVNGSYETEFIVLVALHFMVVCGRVAVCVFMAYLLPGMTAPSVRVFGALAVTMCAQIASELLVLYNPTHPGYVYENTKIDNKCLVCSSDRATIDWECIKQSYSNEATRIVRKEKQEVTWSKIADLILLICIVLLGLILCCTVLASKTIHSLLKQRIPVAIAEKSDFVFSNEKLNSVSSNTGEERFQVSNERTETFWNDFEDEVLRAWFVARVCRGDYVISRSVISSAVWIIVTICLMVFFKLPPIPFLAIVVSPLYGFIVIGYVVICWRWLASLLYCPPIRSWRRHLCLEDFWTSRTVELINMYDLKRERQQFQKINSNNPFLNKSQISLTTKIFTKVRLHKLLYLVVMAQMCVVIFSKVCGIISELTMGNIVYCCRGFVLYVYQQCTKKETQAKPDSYKRILDILCLPGEDSSALWEANKIPLNKAKCLMEKGFKEGISCEEINTEFCSYSLEWKKKGTQLLKDLKEKATPLVLSHFPSVEKNCLKMTVVSLMNILIRVYKAKSNGLTKVVKSCHEVWDLLSFADECDIDLQADNINLLDDLNEENNQVLLAVDREFYKLQMEYDKLPFIEDWVLDPAEVHEILENLLGECEKILTKENLLESEKKKFSRDLHDSRKWTKIAPSYSLYKLCKFMLDDNNGIENFVEWTKESLRNVIACSMSSLPNMLVKQCWIWVQEFEEDKLWEAIRLAGKCKGMMEEWGKDTKTVNTKQHKTLCQQFKMCILCCPRKQQPNQREQPLSNIEQCKIDVNEPSN